MNVLQLISSSIGYYGAERVVVTLSSALEEMGVTSIVAAFRNTSKEVHVEVLDQAHACGLKTEAITCRGRLDWRAVRAVRDLVKLYSIDIIHCHGIKPDLYAFVSACPDVALISTCHLWVYDSARDRLVSVVERSMLHGFDRVIAVSSQIIPELRRFGLRADVIHNGLDLKPFRNANSNLRESMQWNERIVIGAIGRLARQKGLTYLLRAMQEVRREYPQVLLVLAGDGPERMRLCAEARSLGILDAVQFLGIRSDVPELLSSLDIVAMPSLSEGLPMALLEAMASGRSIVATSVGAIPEVIRDMIDGILVAPGDVAGLAVALRSLVQSSQVRTTLGQNARNSVAARFSAAAMASQYCELYREASRNKERLARIQKYSGSHS